MDLIMSGYDSNEDIMDTDEVYTNGGKNYTVLDKPEIRRRQEEHISNFSALLSLPRDLVSFLLYRYRWNVDKLQDDWFANEQSVRYKVGLLLTIDKRDITIADDDNTCKICYEEFAPSNMRSVSCGHKFCIFCWRIFISDAITDNGVASLSLECPIAMCQAAVTRDLIVELASKREMEKYDGFFLRSYVECRGRTTKWCPAPGCEYAVEIEPFDEGNKNCYVVTCDGSHEYCWKCGEEPHKPASCDLVAKWMRMDPSSSQNVSTELIKAYYKTCPKCKCWIDKYMGCNHMKCPPPCRFEFCWICQEEWGQNHDIVMCKKKILLEKNDNHKNPRKYARESDIIYSYYNDKWTSNQSARKRAMEDLQRIEEVDLIKLSEQLKTPIVQLEFIVEAWREIIECRRILKWTYVYGYYLEEKQELFDFKLIEAVNQLDKLCGCANVEVFLVGNDDEGIGTRRRIDLERAPMMDFDESRIDLVNRTRVVRLYFKKFVRDLESGSKEAGVVLSMGSNNSKNGKDVASSSTSNW